MEVLGIRFCSVSDESSAQAQFFDALGLNRRHLPVPGQASAANDTQASEPTGDTSASTGATDGAGLPFVGAVFPAGASWIELWPSGPDMPPGLMLHVVVDDADAFAAHAQRHGLNPRGPMDAHGERIYFLEAPGGLPVALLSAL